MNNNKKTNLLADEVNCAQLGHDAVHGRHRFKTHRALESLEIGHKAISFRNGCRWLRSAVEQGESERYVFHVVETLDGG